MSGCSKTVRSSVATQGWADSGTWGEQVAGVAGAAALPRDAGQHGSDRGHESGVGVGDGEVDAGQAAGGQRAQERQPAGAVLAGGDVQAEDLPVAVGVDADGDQGMDVDDATALADLRPNDHYRMETINGSGTNLSLTTTSASGRDQLRHSWGL